jgi:hypothetical protein
MVERKDKKLLDFNVSDTVHSSSFGHVKKKEWNSSAEGVTVFENSLKKFPSMLCKKKDLTLKNLIFE